MKDERCVKKNLLTRTRAKFVVFISLHYSSGNEFLLFFLINSHTPSNTLTVKNYKA